MRKKGKSIGTLEKYSYAVKGVMTYAPFILITQMILSGSYQITGRQMVISGLLTVMYITFEMKKPAEVGGDENWVVELINKHYTDEEVEFIL